MKLVIHDFKDENEVPKQLFNDDIYMIYTKQPKGVCIGCFGCWINTPGKCIIKDRLKDMGQIFSSIDELVVVSHVYCGGFPSDVKTVVDRSISYLLPFFRMINKEMHHVPRYKQQFKMSAYFYDCQNIEEDERLLTKRYFEAFSVNFNASECCVNFVDHLEEIQL